MALCINQSGTWRNITTNCINDSGTWRKISAGYIKQSNTWREYFISMGISCGGGILICRASGINWIVAPSTSQVSRPWYNRDHAVTTAQQVSGCAGWFIPDRNKLQNPGYTCRNYWDSYSTTPYWSSTQDSARNAWHVDFSNTGWYPGAARYGGKNDNRPVRAFRCVTY